MAEVDKIKHGIIVTCDCGATHKIITDAENNILIKSSFQKKSKEKEIEDDGKKTKIDDDEPSFFD